MTVVYALKTSVLRCYNLLVCDASMVTLLCNSITKGSSVAIPSNSCPHNPTAMELRRANVDGTVGPPS